MTSDLYRQPFGKAAPIASTLPPEPTIERIPRTVDGSTWYAHAPGPDGRTIGAASRTKKGALAQFVEQWGRFAS